MAPIKKAYSDNEYLACSASPIRMRYFLYGAGVYIRYTVLKRYDDDDDDGETTVRRIIEIEDRK